MPKISEIVSRINKFVKDRDLYIFNADFDIEKINSSSSKDFKLQAKSTNCLISLAMDKLNIRYYISLSDTCESVGVDCGDHRAKSDTLHQ